MRPAADGLPAGMPLSEALDRFFRGAGAEAIASQVNKSDFTQLRQFESYACKRFDLHLLAGSFADARLQPQVPLPGGQLEPGLG